MSNFKRLLACWLLGILAPAAMAADPVKPGNPVNPANPSAAEAPFKLPPGFSASLFADDDLAHDIFSMTLDSRGRVTVAGPNYIKILPDENGDGRADRAILFSKLPKSGAHGLYWHGQDLFASGDNSLLKFSDRDGDDQADGAPISLATLRHPEHGTNGIVLGPDGLLYIICGNDAGVSQMPTDTHSPVSRPVAGALVRMSLDGTRSEVVAHGFRNPYDIAFSREGRMLTFDADGERDQYLPWYEPTRIFDIQVGREHGWVLGGWQRSWSRPASFYDAMPRLWEVGRGSPTGVEIYRHTLFPAHYQGGLFAACWSLGTIYHFPLKLAGETYQTKLEIFLQPAGHSGFAPVDLAVGPRGDLFIAIGGRNTRGAVYRITYSEPAIQAAKPVQSEVEQVLSAPQPSASWSRAIWAPQAMKLGKPAFEAAVLDEKLPAPLRARAIEILVDLFKGPSRELGANESIDQHPLVAARMAWALGYITPVDSIRRRIVQLTGAKDPVVAQAAWESLAATAPWPGDEARNFVWPDPMAPQRLQEAAMLGMLANSQSIPAPELGKMKSAAGQSAAEIRAYARTEIRNTRFRYAKGILEFSFLPRTSNRLRLELLNRTVELFAISRDDAVTQLQALRLAMQLQGDLQVTDIRPEVLTGYTLTMKSSSLTIDPMAKAVGALALHFPQADRQVNLELARLLGGVQSTDGPLKLAISAQLTSDSPLTDDIHYLIVLSRLPGERDEQTTRRIAACLMGLHGKMDKIGALTSRNWPLRVAELTELLIQADPRLPGALLETPGGFARVEHALFLAKLPEAQRAAAGRKLLAAALAARPDQISPELLQALAAVQEPQVVAAFRQWWSRPELRDALLPRLAAVPTEEDRARYLQALATRQDNLALAAIGALAKLDPTRTTPDELLLMLQAYRAASAAPPKGGKPAPPSRRKAEVGELLGRWTHHLKKTPPPAATAEYEKWRQWFAANYPQFAEKLAATDNVDWPAFKKRLDSLDFTKGEATRGKMVYQSRACAACHAGGSRLGPDLAGVGKRFSREDLFNAIVDPNQQVSPAYHPMRITTKDGQSHVGFLVYDSPETTLLQTGPGVTVRITGDQFQSQQAENTSLMPAGLLNGITDQDLIDLEAYLRGL